MYEKTPFLAGKGGKKKSFLTCELLKSIFLITRKVKQAEEMKFMYFTINIAIVIFY